MFWVSKAIAPLALVAGIATTTLVMAEEEGNQPPFGKGPPGKFEKKFDRKGRKGDKGDKKEDMKEEKREEKKAPPGDKKGAPKADAVVEAWLKVLLEKITDPHDTVRDSARGAVVAIGPVAIPTLQKLAEGNDPAKALAAQKLIHAIHQHHGHGQHGPGGPGGPGHGFGPHFGMGGPGGHPGMEGHGWGGWGWGHGMGRGGPGGGPGGWERGPGGPPGKGPGGPPGMGPGKGPGGPPGKGPKGPRGGREEEENETSVAPMPHDAVRR